MTVIVRFAPSPTGKLHVGNVRAALWNWLFARSRGGRFILRIDDTDQERSTSENEDRIRKDMTWLGLNWDGDVLFQSQRQAIYAAALQTLIDGGFAYRCWCTRADIASAMEAPQDGGPPVYPGTCKGRDGSDDTRPYSWRLDVRAACAAAGPLFWSDVRAGQVAADPALLGDVVIARKDAMAAYHLAVVVDDAGQGVTDVVRGGDLFESTHIHRLLQHLLGFAVPNYHHHNLVCGADGTRLAKRKNAPTLQALRETGTDPAWLLAQLRSGALPDGFSFCP